ncbi:sushi, von Willebrand factor type A, EGF and pentraxin domain-containing protein 1-like isoform X2 [Mercenaria mercenaria]|uniref:sushi, von Willebrand factor type A, EGF and pentraxin domain-containing protein 1-like isoform X2 n=1 Tax=Mercenaria mercenaria TaxID=6596 RepID=UPI00234F4496|nr:sushi, von Willebrand factor type A, EGF and pentraxin domain-containing protein 1-like isoform X2 [Mercenaria mercenaria]
MTTKVIFIAVYMCLIQRITSVGGTRTTVGRNDCGQPHDPTNGRVYLNGNVTTYNSTATYTCNDGYTRVGEPISRCDSSGSWSNPPVCKIKDCGNLTDPSNGKVDLPNGTTFLSVGKFRCNVGHTLHGDKTAVCTIKGKWSDHYVTCTANDCHRPNPSGNGSVDTTNGTTYESVVAFACNTGFHMEGASKSICQANGSWSAPSPICVVKDVRDCGRLPNPANGAIKYARNMTSVWSSATYSCQPGFRMIGPEVIHCDAQGNWSSYTTYCQIKDCGNLADPLYGKTDMSNGTTYLSVVKYSCNIGYTLNGDNATTCTATGKWSDHYVNCTINDCLSPVNPGNGSVDTTKGTTFGSIVIFSCNIGFDLEGESSASCLANSSWNVSSPNCKIKDCGALPDPEHGYIMYSRNLTSFGSHATYTCQPGFKSIGSEVILCDASGHWSSNETHCEIKNCGNLTDPPNGTVDLSNGTTYQSVGKYSCNIGYTLQGDNSTICTETGKWKTHDVECKINDCHSPCHPGNGSVDTTTGTTVGSIVTFSCNTGFDLKGERHAICQVNSSWNITLPTCSIKDCGKPNQTANGKYWLDARQLTVFNHTATYKCNSGYETADKTLITCNSSGKWSDMPPKCNDIDECARYTARCHRRAQCTNTNGSYVCKCDDGFRDISMNGEVGIECQDINECANNNTNLCNRKGSQCINYPGAFLCLCDDGWTGNNCSTENVIIDLETVVTRFRGDDQLIDAKPIHNRFPYFGEEYNSYRPNMNGFLTLGYQPLYEDYGPETPTDWQKFSRGYPVIAPLWTNIDSTNLTGGLDVHLFEYYSSYGQNDSQHRDLSRLGNIFSNYLNLIDFKPRVALVATWRNVTKSSYIVPARLIKTQNATMQVILISDGIFSYVMFNYNQEQWSLKMDKNIHSSAGFSLQDKTGFITATRKNISQLNNGTNVNPGLKGRWIYNVTKNDLSGSATLRNESKCLAFRQNDTIRNWITAKLALSYPCPCSEQ